MIYFKSLGSVLGETEVSTHELLNTATGLKKETLTRTGFARIFQSAAESSFEMCIRLLQPFAHSISDVDLIISVSSLQTSNPGIGTLIHKEFKMSSYCDVLEIQEACTGFVTALNLSVDFIEIGKYKKILILLSDQYTKYFSPELTSLSLLFSDGASAQLVIGESKVDDLKSGFLPLERMLGFSKIDSSGEKQLNINVSRDNVLTMKGGGVFQFVLANLKEALAQMRVLNLPSEEVNWYIHQGSAAVVESVELELNLAVGSLFRAKQYGNLVGSSIPAQFSATPIAENSYCAFLAFGMGLRMQLSIFKTGKYL